MGLLSLLRIKPKVIDDVFDKDGGILVKAGEWYGNKDFTEEEKAEHMAKIGTGVRKFVVDTLGESTERSKARRDIATTVVKFYLLLVFMVGMTFPINPNWSKVWLELASLPTLGGLVISVGLFFFGSHALTRHHEAKNVK